MVGGSAYFRRLHALESEHGKVKLIYKRIHRPNLIVSVDIVVR